MELRKLEPLPISDYLAGELESDIRHEYIAGEVYAMVGATERHNLISLNIASALRECARGSGCRVFMADVKLHVEASNAFYYPDVFVTCDADDTQVYYKEHPCLIVEVLSTSTAATDRREKRFAYQGISSLREYVLVEQDRKQIEVYRREGEAWSHILLGEGDRLQLDCVDLWLTTELVYEEVSVDS